MASTSGRSSRSTLTLTKASFIRAAMRGSSNDSWAMTWHQWQGGGAAGGGGGGARGVAGGRGGAAAAAGERGGGVGGGRRGGGPARRRGGLGVEVGGAHAPAGGAQPL